MCVNYSNKVGMKVN